MNWIYAAVVGVIVISGMIMWLVKLVRKAQTAGILKDELIKLDKIDKMENEYADKLEEAKRKFISNYPS